MGEDVGKPGGDIDLSTPRLGVLIRKTHQPRLRPPFDQSVIIYAKKAAGWSSTLDPIKRPKETLQWSFLERETGELVVLDFYWKTERHLAVSPL
jgi:hypothetical protein